MTAAELVLIVVLSGARRAIFGSAVDESAGFSEMFGSGHVVGNLRNVQMIRLFRSRSADSFKSRSSERDAEADSAAVVSVADAINLVLEQAESERVGLKRRIDDVVSRAALVGGNDTDEFITRSADRSEMLKKSDADIKRGQERLSTIDKNMSHFRFLRSVLQSRFPNSKL